MEMIALPLVVCAVGALILWFTVSRALQRLAVEKRSASEAAAALGLKFVDAYQELAEFAASDTAELPERLSWQKRRGSSQQQAGSRSINPELVRSLLKKPWAANLAKRFMPWRLEGEFDGQRVLVDTVHRGSGNSRQRYSQFRVFFGEPLPFEFVVSKEGLGHRLGKAIGAVRDVQLGNPDVDRKLLIKAESESQVQRWLGRREQSVLLELFQTYPDAVVDAEGIRYECSFKIDQNFYREVLERLSRSGSELRK